MKGTRLKDVLGNKVYNKEKWDMLFGKFKKLATAIEMFKGSNMSIDDIEYRWVNDRIEYYNQNDRLLTVDEMNTANTMWRQYK